MSLRLSALMAALTTVAIMLLASCHGGPHPEFTVSTTVDGPDAAVGDGVCEVTEGAGDCSLRAAIDEVNAAGVAGTIHLSAATYLLDGDADDDANVSGDLDVTGIVTIQGHGATIAGSGTDRLIDVAAGGQLRLFETTLADGWVAGPGGGARVTGRLDLLAAAAVDNVSEVGGGAVAVTSDGDLRSWNSTISGNEAPTGAGVNVDGTASIEYTTITANDGGGIAGGGTVTLTASMVADQVAGADCGEPPASTSHSLDSDDTCALSGPGDRPAGSAQLHPLSGASGSTPAHRPAAGSDALEAVPLGSAGCGSDATVDQHLVSRPADTACEIGAVEVAVADTVGLECEPLQAIPGADLRRCDLTSASLEYFDLTGADLSGADLTSASLIGSTLTDVVITGATIDGTDLTGAVVDGIRSGDVEGTPVGLDASFELVMGYLVGPDADLTGAQLSQASLPGMDFGAADLTGADLSGADLTGAGVLGTAVIDLTDFSGATMHGFDGEGARFDSASFVGADMTGINLSWSWVTGGDMTNAVLTDANLDEGVFSANMTGVRSGGVSAYYAVLPAGVDWFLGYLWGPFTDLTSIDLSGQDLTNVQMEYFDLSGSDLSFTILTAADLTFTDLTDVDLTGASGTPIGAADAVYGNTTCPTGVNSDANGGTCVGEGF